MLIDPISSNEIKGENIRYVKLDKFEGVRIYCWDGTVVTIRPNVTLTENNHLWAVLNIY
jgi:hypothetical protein